MTATAWQGINSIRVLAMDAVEQAKSGHPGTPMALAPAAYLLFTEVLRHAPTDPHWPDRDRFVLSCGHASMLQYALAHLCGYDLSLDEIKRFRQLGARTAGHPERGHVPGVEVTTGPLGQGVANAVGLAIAERMLAERFNRPGHRVVDHRTWAFVSDGDLMEGIASEAGSLAGHLQLGKLTLIWDDNHITIDGRTEITFTEDVAARFAAYGWHVVHVAANDGNDLDAIRAAYAAAVAETARPTFIVLKTVIGDPAPTRRDTPEAHGSPLGAEEIAKTKAILGWPSEPFHVPEAARVEMGKCRARGEQLIAEWRARVQAWRAAHPDLAAEWDRGEAGALPAGWDAPMPVFEAGKAVATREASGQVLQALAPALGEFVGGSADLSGNTGVKLKGVARFTPGGEAGRLVNWGIREHAMAACANGIAAHGGLRPFVSTFFVFFDYMKPSIRLAAIMELPVIFIGTHDSIGVGEDGPTHQPVEQLAMLRAVPNLVTIRPADATETAEAWRVAITRREGPTALVLTRQKLPVLDRGTLAPAAGLHRGAYVLKEASAAPKAIVLATGSEVSVALAAATQLEAAGVPVRVVSMPSWELFERQPFAYREEVLPAGVTARVAIEAASPLGWHRWVGSAGEVIGMESFGASAPAEQLFPHFQLTAEAVVHAVQRLVAGQR